MVKKLCSAVLANCLLLAATAQKPFSTDLDICLTSEGQYNMTNRKANWINLLEVCGEVNLSNHFIWTADLISVQNTRLQKDKGKICEDMQVFSNIEEENLEVSLSAFGPTWLVNEDLELFTGVRNINMDYFTSFMTSVFTGSSQGIYPTISANWELAANYPLSAMCFHLEWRFIEKLEFKSSFYNGVAYDRATDVFRFRPERDGIFTISQVGYVEPEDSEHRLGSYYVGFTYGNAPDENGKKSGRNSIYALIEQPLTRNTGMLLSGGRASGSQACHSYYSAGVIWSDLFKKGCDLGLLTNRALYLDGRETDIEVTCCMPLTKHVAVQPALHFIRTSGTSNSIGLFRVNIRL